MKANQNYAGEAESGDVFHRRAVRVVLPVLVLGLAALPLSAGEPRTKPLGGNGVVKPPPTHGQISKQQQNVRTDRKIKAAPELIKTEPRTEPARSERMESLIGRSAILSLGQHWTIVPKGSVIHVPQHLAARVNGPRSGTLIPWKEFLVKNRGWLQTQDVNISQARGEAALSEESTKFVQSSGRVVVAVCHEGPISVKPLKEELADARGAAQGTDRRGESGRPKPALK